MPNRRPQMQSIAPSATSAETAAIAAAIEQFARATATAGQNDPERPDPWVRAAILEGVTREDPELMYPASG